jgi:hypothetical protein
MQKSELASCENDICGVIGDKAGFPQSLQLGMDVHHREWDCLEGRLKGTIAQKPLRRQCIGLGDLSSRRRVGHATEVGGNTSIALSELWLGAQKHKLRHGPIRVWPCKNPSATSDGLGAV